MKMNNWTSQEISQWLKTSEHVDHVRMNIRDKSIKLCELMRSIEPNWINLESRWD